MELEEEDLFAPDIDPKTGTLKIEGEKETNLFIQTLHKMNDRREMRDNGFQLSIPWPFHKLNAVLPGISEGKYYLVTANQKVGKTAIGDYIFVYNTVYEYYKGRSSIKPKIFYFSLELDKESKMIQAMCHFVYREFNVRISPGLLFNTLIDKKLTLKEIEYINDLGDFFEVFCECVTFIDNIRNVFGIYKFMREKAREYGHLVTSPIEVKNANGRIEIIEEFKSYTKHDPNQWLFCMIDHYGLFTPENKTDIRSTISKWSSEYAILLRNHYKMIIVGVQQQAADKETVQYTNVGNNVIEKNRPSPDGLADNKTTSRDCNMLISLFDPSRYKVSEYKGVNFSELMANHKARHRELSILLNRDGDADYCIQLAFYGDIQLFLPIDVPPNQYKPKH